MLSFYEFFAGGGMARAGLGAGWKCAFANDFDFKKAETYKLNWGGDALKVGDVRKLETSKLPDQADLAWASFPCQDLSLAGGGAGLRGDRSGTFWPFWELMKTLRAENRAPRAIVLENVCGTLTSHQGKDFSAIATALAKEDYRFGALVIDAALFVPHSRPRLFIVAIRDDVQIPLAFQSPGASSIFHTRSLKTAHARMPPEARAKWIWWRLPGPSKRKSNFADLIEENPKSCAWHSARETQQLLAMMSDINLEKVEAAKESGRLMVGAIYKRTRLDESDVKVQRAEVRFDDVAGCLRTPAGGSSRQLILVVRGDKVRSRLISTRETARLMGLPNSYQLPTNYNEAYHLTGDGVVVPVVRHLAAYLLEPILNADAFNARAAA
ncbi:MAG TPA: DNA cytosine methyltransferase [Rhizomicrobium sp.]|jgi:DNA (cytosine-5)-methyltransferase 1